MTETPRLFELLLNNIQDHALFYLDKEGNIQGISQGARKMFQCNNDAVGQPLTRICKIDHEVGKRNIETDLKRALEKGSVNHDYWFSHENGVPFWGREVITSLKDNSNNVHGFVVAVYDMSESKQKDLLLHDANEFTESIVETVRESLIVLDENIKIVQANSFFYETFKVTPEETVGKSLYKLGNGQWNIPALRELLEQILPRNNPFEDFAVEHEFPKIGHRIMLLNARQIELRGAKSQRILLAIEDITTRKESEQRKDDFISMASHELKTPVTSIKAFNQLLQQYFKRKKELEPLVYLDKMAYQIDKLIHLITDLLDVSRIQTGKLEFRSVEFDFDSLVQEIVETLDPTFKTHTIVMEGKTNKKVKADYNRIGQVITNFITNAVKYSPHGSTIVVRLSSDDSHVKLSVIDQGEGIEQDHLAHIFERFYRVNDKNDQTFPGLGIGLYIASQIIQKQHGTISVESEKHKGSTFSFSLPVSTHS